MPPVWESQINKGILARAQRQGGLRAANPAEQNWEKLHIAIAEKRKGPVTNTKEEREFRKIMGLKLNVNICAKWQDNLYWSVPHNNLSPFCCVTGYSLFIFI